jgi:glycerol-3-phosphate dehydrogenase
VFSADWRQKALAGLGKPFDLVVIGGGVTGCGIFFDAAQRGLRVLLLEKDDVAAGTSSRSSKLVHGGLRYLKKMRFHLTRQACRERDRMLALSPHLVKPIQFIYPIYKGDRPPAWQVEIGLRMYDRMTRGPRHGHLKPADLAEVAPGVPDENLSRALIYQDALTDDALLTLGVAGSGYDQGGLLLTRAVTEEGVRDAAGRLRGLRFRDLETGAVHQAESHLLVNATGAWVDTLRHRLGLTGERVRPSRGSHLVFAACRLPIRAAVTIPSPDDGRPVFFIPHPEGVLAGTTDLFHDGPLDDPRPSPEETAYLLRSVRTAFPEAGISERDIRGSFAGVRPIVDTETKDPSQASREEAVWEEQGLLSVAGGKLTTWRAMAEEVVDFALTLLPAERRRAAKPCATTSASVGAPVPTGLEDQLASDGVAVPVADAMVRRLGGLALAAFRTSPPEDLQPLLDGADLCAAEVRAHLRHGAAARLEDLLLRRARFGLWDPATARDLAPHVAAIAAAELGWTGARRERELEECGKALAGWSPPGERPLPEHFESEICR